MTRRLLLIAMLAAAFLAVSSTPAQAAFNCGGFYLDRPVFNAGTGVVASGYGASCGGAMWKIDLFLQIEIGGAWQDANCVDTQPCYARRPKTAGSWYDPGTTHTGTANFDVRGGCTSRYRTKMFLASQGGVVFGPYVSTPSNTC